MRANVPQCPERLGPYELVRHVATGGMAEVYLARRTGPHGFSKTVALKRILPQLARDPDFVAMFVDEARVCAQLSHPNLVQVFDFGEDGSELFMAMEYVDGTTCAKVVRRAAARMDFVPIEASLHVIVSVLRGLEYAHAAVDVDGRPLGLVHRDVSPGNILIASSGAVKLGDFGIARADEFERRTEEGQLKGKLGYMSPEQVTGRPLDSRSDLFTLTIVMAELLTSRALFGVGSELDVLMKIRDADLSVFERHSGHLPEDLRSIVRKGLEGDPERRFPTASAFVEAIDDFVRQKRLSVGPSRLAQWLEDAGLVSGVRAGDAAHEARVQSPAGHGPSAPARDRRRGSPLGSLAVTAPAPSPGQSASSSAPPELKGRLRLADGSQGDLLPAIYRIASGDAVLGPMPYATLVELVATGRTGSETLVSRENGPFRPARDLPELARLLVSPALAPVSADPSLVRETWPVDRARLPGILYDLSLRKETGLLSATQGERKKKFFLVDGAPTFTTSTDKKELLGQQLIASGLAVPMEVDMALALSPRYGGRLGDALVGLGVLRPHELFRALMAQAQERFVDLLSWTRGTLEFVHGLRAEGDALLHGSSPLETITRGILQSYPDQELEDLLGPLLDQQVRAVSVIEQTLHDLGLPGREGAALLLVDRPTTVEEIVELCGASGIASRGEALRGLFIGLSARAIVSSGWPPPVQRPSVPTMKM
ncbi:MAG TPA: protein kinase [Polyangiaceae bacterium]|nr:protein kinase [Polyangiaceae bacterium]